MISIIIASVDPNQLNRLKINIKNTIGVPYEIQAFENSNAKIGLCSLYNKASKLAIYDLIVFMHEDICITTKNWGKILIDIFKDASIGIVGVAGTGYKSVSLSGNYCYGIDAEFINIIQGFKHQAREKHIHYKNPNGKPLAEVASLDGVWLATKKEVLDSYSFDDTTFNGFHCYDIDFCMNVGRFYKVMVTFDILIEHYSEGKFDGEWAYEIVKLHKKWNDILPINKVGLSKREMQIVERGTFKNFIAKALSFGFGKIEMFKLLSANNGIKKISLYLYLKLAIYIAKK